MKTSKFILVLSMIIFLISLLLLFITLNKYGVTGFATSDTGTANFSITALASIVFTDASCDFGAGTVYDNATFALIWSNATTVNATGWTGCLNGTALENDGNSNISVNLTSSAVAAAFIGGTSVTPTFQWKVTNTSSCLDAGLLEAYTEVTALTISACDKLNLSGTLQLDFALKIPDDAVGGAHGTVITATGAVVS